jgi:hypothetical protein
MPGRGPSLVVRILRLVLIVFGPLVFSVVVVMLHPPGPEAGAKMLLLVSGAWLFCSLILTPALLSSGSESSSGPADTDEGGGTDPRQPPSPPIVPRGGIPLPDAEQARERVRDHDRPDRVICGIRHLADRPSCEHEPREALPARHLSRPSTLAPGSRRS